MIEFWKVAVAAAGLGAIGAFVFWSLYRGWLRLGIFAALNPRQTFTLMVLFLTLSFGSLLAILTAFVLRPDALRTADCDEDVCVLSGSIIDTNQRPVAGASVHADIDGDEVAQDTTDNNGYYSLRVKKGLVVDLNYDLDRRYVGWDIAARVVVNKNLKFPVAILGKDSENATLPHPN